MAGEYNAKIETFVSTVLVEHPRLGRVRMNATSYDTATCGAIIEGPTMPHTAVGVSDPADKDPKLDATGRAIAEQHSPLHRA